MNWHITTHKGGWKLYKGKRGVLSSHKLRRDAIARAKKVAGKDDVIYVHSASGGVVIRIPELPPVDRVAAAVWIKRAAEMSPEGRKRIAAWLRDQANSLVKLGDKYSTNFRGRYHAT